MADRRGIRWFADESVLGLGKLLARERDDVAYPGHPACTGLEPGALDTEWMPLVAAWGWVVFHRDRRIRTRPAELEIFRAEGLRAVWFAGKKDLSPYGQLELLQRHWQRLEREVQRLGPGPWALNLLDGGLRQVPLRDR